MVSTPSLVPSISVTFGLGNSCHPLVLSLAIHTHTHTSDTDTHTDTKTHTPGLSDLIAFPQGILSQNTLPFVPKALTTIDTHHHLLPWVLACSSL
jgi:hypothetical protein